MISRIIAYILVSLAAVAVAYAFQDLWLVLALYSDWAPMEGLMTIQIWRAATLAAAVAALAFSATVDRISRPVPVKPVETLFRAVLVPSDVRGWMHFGSRQLGQPAWLAKQQEGACASH